MRIIILLFLIFISNILNSQITLENTLTGIYNRSDNKEFNLSLNGNNSFIYKKIKLDNSTNYQLSLSDKIKSNEFLNRNSISITSKKRYFIFHQYNYSSNRKNISNFIGAGFYFFTTKDTNNIVTFSYASVFENVYNPNNTNYNYPEIFNAIRYLEIVNQYRASNPNATVKLFLYTPGVGIGDPSQWKWIFIIKN